MVRESIATWFVRKGIGVGRLLGCEEIVEVSDHSINISMGVPDKEQRAWDDTLYKKGQLFVAGYANPVKIRTVRNETLDQPDTVDVEEGQVDADVAADGGDAACAKVISSQRYQSYMRQDLIDSLLTPSAKWRLIAYGVIGLGAIQFLSIIITLYATGSF